MATTTRKRKPPRYHHGDLRHALIDVAEVLLDEGGPEAVTLREASRRLGVTAAAVYRHFADRDSLLSELAVRGFDAFGQALHLAAAGAKDPLAAMGQAYVRFAVARPGRFRLMFGPAVADRSRHPALLQAVERASIGFRGVAAGETPDEHAAAMLRAWAVIHGLSHLLIDGMLPGQDPELLARVLTKSKSPT
ncbi:MAG: TetR/AcrR family transcriptional regulator [Pseudomonadota bacterium]